MLKTVIIIGASVFTAAFSGVPVAPVRKVQTTDLGIGSFFGKVGEVIEGAAKDAPGGVGDAIKSLELESEIKAEDSEDDPNSGNAEGSGNDVPNVEGDVGKAVEGDAELQEVGEIGGLVLDA